MYPKLIIIDGNSLTEGNEEILVEELNESDKEEIQIEAVELIEKLVDGTEVAILEKVAEEIDGEIRNSYSGRGMYGKQCMGIVCEDPIKCIETAGKYGLKGAKMDNMGQRSIVYWPKIQNKE